MSLAACRSLPKTPFVVAVLLVCLSSFFMPAFRLVSFLACYGLLVGLCLICGHVRRPPIGGSTSSNVMSGEFSPSTTALADCRPFRCIPRPYVIRLSLLCVV